VPATAAVSDHPSAAGARRRRVAGSGLAGDAAFRALSVAAGLVVLALLGAIILSLFIGGLPAFRTFGFGFLTSATWDPNPAHASYGAAVPILGTITTSVLALLMAVPVAFGIAFFLTELAPDWVRRPVGTAIELLAGIPSIIYGMWGLYVVAPILGSVVEPWLDAHLHDLADQLSGIPVLGWASGVLADVLEQGPADGKGVFTAALILAIMVVPFIAATMRDVFLTVPAVFKESAYGIGCTTWEVMRSIVIPYTRTSVVGGIMLGLGRALGETMAVTFVIGSNHHISSSIFDAGDTIASLVALEFPESVQDPLRVASILALGFVLFVLSFIVLAASRLLLRQPGLT
jgi:phosphate transport system permease protein